MALAEAWQKGGEAGFPPAVHQVLHDSGVAALRGLRLLLALPEYKVRLPGGHHASQTDVLALARGESGLVVLAVEGKVTEAFGPTVAGKRHEPSDGMALRLRYLLDCLGLPHDVDDRLRYQLLHRAGSALLTAEQFFAPTAVLLVHSFDPENTGLRDFQAFTGLFQTKAEMGKVARLGRFGGRALFAAWAGAA